MSKDIELVRANEADAKTIWYMQKTAFLELFNKYKDYDTNPANEPLNNVINRLKQSFTYYYIIKLNGKNIGAIRVIDKKLNNEMKRISPLFILPEYRGNGYAKLAISLVEKNHGDCGWELETILQEIANCKLYEKMGYKKTNKIKKINSRLTLIFYVK